MSSSLSYVCSNRVVMVNRAHARRKKVLECAPPNGLPELGLPHSGSCLIGTPPTPNSWGLKSLPLDSSRGQDQNARLLTAAAVRGPGGRLGPGRVGVDREGEFGTIPVLCGFGPRSGQLFNKSVKQWCGRTRQFGRQPKHGWGLRQRVAIRKQMKSLERSRVEIELKSLIMAQIERWRHA